MNFLKEAEELKKEGRGEGEEERTEGVVGGEGEGEELRARTRPGCIDITIGSTDYAKLFD